MVFIIFKNEITTQVGPIALVRLRELQCHKEHAPRSKTQTYPSTVSKAFAIFKLRVQFRVRPFGKSTPPPTKKIHGQAEKILFT